MLLAGFIAGLGYFPHAWGASNQEQAEAGLARAQAEYYRAVRDGKATTPDELRQLQREVVDPAVEDLTKVIAEKEKAAIRKHVGVEKPEAAALPRPASDTVFTPQEVEALKKMVEAENMAFGRGVPEGDSEINVGKKDAKVQSKPAKASKPETVIDGKQFPELIEFRRGVNGAAPAPAAAASPVPLVPSNNGGEAGLLEFPGGPAAGSLPKKSKER
jgi:hypothetical protein